MSEKRFTWKVEKLQHFDDEVIMVVDNANKEWKGHILNIVDKLNEQESTIISLKERNKQLRRRLEKINGGYGHLIHRKGLTANEWVIERQEKELRKKNEQISDWIERHSKDIVKIGEQQTTISALKEENEQLRQQIQNYEQLFANSYVGIEETLDGFIGKYVIWEDELQKYRKKVMNDE